MNHARSSAAAIVIIAALAPLAGCQLGADQSPSPHAPCPPGEKRSVSASKPVVQYACYPVREESVQ